MKFSGGSLLLLTAQLRIVATLPRDETTEKIFRAPRKEAKDATDRYTHMHTYIRENNRDKTYTSQVA